MVETERINLPDEAWWDIRATLTRGMEKAVTRATLAHIPRLPRNGQAMTTTEAVTDELLRNLKDVDISAIEDAYLMYGTVAYSYGEKVDQETIDSIDAEVVRRVINRMFELYNPQKLTEGQRQDFFEKPSPVTLANPALSSLPS